MSTTLCECGQDCISAYLPAPNRFQSQQQPLSPRDMFPSSPPLRQGEFSLDMLTSPPRRTAVPPQARCRKVTLDVTGASGMTASETNPEELSGMGWNLASAGRVQDGEGMLEVKRLKMVTLEFGAVEGECLKVPS